MNFVRNVNLLFILVKNSILREFIGRVFQFTSDAACLYCVLQGLLDRADATKTVNDTFKLRHPPFFSLVLDEKENGDSIALH